MLSTLKTIPVRKYLLVILSLIVFFSCQKTLDFEDAGATNQLPDLTTKVSSSASGFVTDENDTPVMGASVQVGSATITTDKYGYFEAKNVQVVKQAAVVTVNKPGYFKGIKTYIATEGKAAFFRIKLIPKMIMGTINAGTGGFIARPDGFSVKLIAGSIVNASTNALYTGPVTVAAYWIKPTAADLPNIMPGDLRGIDVDGYLKILQTYGMAAVELTGSSGELLQIVNGQKATVTIPLPSSLTATAPATIPLWYFEEPKGLWKQEGTATKTGNMYTCEVGHFSFWNCDVPASFVQFNCTLKNPAGIPLAYTSVKITDVTTNSSGWGYTDSSGYVGGAVPANANLLLEVFPGYGCGNAIYSQTFTTTNINVSLGTITVTAANNLSTFTGMVSNCSNTAVTDGYIILQEGNFFTRHRLSNTGTFSFNKLFCSLPQTVNLIGEDITNTQQSASLSYVVNAGTNTVGNIQACGVATQQFINYTINGTPYNYTYPVDSFSYTNSQYLHFAGSNFTPPASFISIIMSNAGLAQGSTQFLQEFIATVIPDSFRILTPIPVNITEYGSIGQYTAGTFSGTITGASPANIQYNVNCNFRIRRAN